MPSPQRSRDAAEAAAGRAPPSGRVAVLLGHGRYEDEVAGHDAEGGPRRSFIEFARRTQAEIFSFVRARRRLGPVRGWLFARLFAARPEWGSALALRLRLAAFDHVFATGEDVGLRLAILSAGARRRPRTAIVVHNLTPKKAWLLRRFARRPEYVFVVLCRLQEEALRAAGVDPARIRRLHEGIDLEFFRPAPSAPGEELIACGAEKRDYRTLAAAMAGCRIEVAVFGHGYTGENAADDAGARPEAMRLMPRAPFGDLLAAYQRARAVVLPLEPTRFASGLNGILEAMAVGKGVVVTDNPGLSDYTRACRGIIVPPGDPAALRRALERVAEGALDRPEVGAENRRWVEAHCALDTYVGALEAAVGLRPEEAMA